MKPDNKAEEKQIGIFVCSSCTVEFSWSENLGDRLVENVPGIGKVYETGITCPECEHFTLVAYISEGLLKERDRLAKKAQKFEGDPNDYNRKQYIDGMTSYRRRFDRFNSEMARRYKTDLLGQQRMRELQAKQRIAKMIAGNA